MQFLNNSYTIIKSQIYKDFNTIKSLPSAFNDSKYAYALCRLVTISCLVMATLNSLSSFMVGMLGKAFYYGTVTILTHDVLQMMINEEKEGSLRGISLNALKAAVQTTGNLFTFLFHKNVEISPITNSAINFAFNVSKNTILQKVWIPFLTITREAYIRYKLGIKS